jgi:hypothetical protein
LRATSSRRHGRLIVGLYAWATAAYFGCVWLDTIYGHALAGRDPAAGAVADALLAASAGMGLAGISAIAAAWTSPRARAFLLCSLVIALLMLPAPAVFGAALAGQAAVLGPPIRLVLAGCVSLLAFLGFGGLGSHG